LELNTAPFDSTDIKFATLKMQIIYFDQNKTEALRT